MNNSDNSEYYDERRLTEIKEIYNETLSPTQISIAFDSHYQKVLRIC
jgi:hypothetical protein